MINKYHRLLNGGIKKKMKIPYIEHAFNGLSVLKDETQVYEAEF